jgi:hypothetical protein
MCCRYACADTFRNLTRGFEEVPMRTDEPQQQQAEGKKGAGQADGNEGAQQ